MTYRTIRRDTFNWLLLLLLRKGRNSKTIHYCLDDPSAWVLFRLSTVTSFRLFCSQQLSLSLSGPRRGEREGERSVPYATALCPSHFCAQFTRKGEKEEVIKLEIKNKGWRPRLLPWMEEVGVTKVSQVSYVSMLRQVCKEGGRRRRR